MRPHDVKERPRTKTQLHRNDSVLSPQHSVLSPRSVLRKCHRCGGLLFPDEDGERFCLMCGERVYDWQDAYIERLLDAVERRALKDRPEFRVRPHPNPPSEREGS